MDDLPPPIQLTPNSPTIPEPPDSKTVNNFKKAFIWICKIKWGRVSAYIVGFVGVVGILYSLPPTRNFIEKNFPNSSPVFGREVSMQGILKGSSTGLYTLVLPDQQAYTLHFKPSASLANMKKLNEVVVKGRLGWTAFVIEDAEVFPLNFVISDESNTSSPNSLNTLNSPIPANALNTPKIPDLYPKMKWETSQKRVLIFTSGKRKIEQEGNYLESSQLTSFPQDFINYYIEGLKSAGFKETLNSISPEGITTTYAKDDSFLTFGIKNIYKGSGASKQLIGYVAYLEHN